MAIINRMAGTFSSNASLFSGISLPFGASSLNMIEIFRTKGVETQFRRSTVVGSGL